MKTSGRLAVATMTVTLGIAALCASASTLRQQERPGVPAPVGQPNFTLTRHGNVSFEADVSRPDGRSITRVVLKETIEIAGVKNAQPWLDFIHSFADSTAQALLDALPPSASRKKGKVIVEFALRSNGALDAPVSLARASGDASIDAAARVAIAKAAPFGALPANSADPLAHFRVAFAYDHPPATAHTGGPQ